MLAIRDGRLRKVGFLFQTVPMEGLRGSECLDRVRLVAGYV